MAFLSLSLSNVFAQKIDFPLTGTWYNPITKQLFSFDADKDGSIKGRGVYYGNGTGKLVQMQIMTQTTSPIESGENAYLLRAYDPAKPKMVYEIVSYPGTSNLVLRVTETGKRDKFMIFYNLNDLKTP